MPETDEERSKRELRELEGKNVAHYSVLLSAWIQTKMERDKTLVTLSSAAIALLVTILSTAGIKFQIQLFLFAGAFVGFSLCIWTSLKIYQLNSIHLENELRHLTTDLELEKYDKQSLISFLTGVVFLCFIGLSSAYLATENKGHSEMSRKEATDRSQSVTEKKSLDGISNLKPENTTPPAPPSNQGGQSGSTENKAK